MLEYNINSSKNENIYKNKRQTHIGEQAAKFLAVVQRLDLNRVPCVSGPSDGRYSDHGSDW